MTNDYSQMIKDFSSFDIELTDKQLDQFDQYYQLLIKWNEVMNLTAITEFNDVCKLHFVDSISGCKYFDFSKKDYSLVDIGTGARMATKGGRKVLAARRAKGRKRLSA